MKYCLYISKSLLIVSGFILFCTIFATDINLVNGLVTGKVHWFHQSMLLLGVCSLVATILTKPERWFTFSIADVFVFVLVAIVILTYDWKLNPEPEKLLFGGQLMVLWFLLRIVFAGWPYLRLVFLTFVIGTGFVEAILGMRQLHGFEASHHSLFNLTGDFYNPGPYSGYLAIILPVCLWVILQFADCKKEGWRQVKVYLYYWGWVTLSVIIVVLPAGMSRAAWIAAVISCVWVYWTQRIGWEKTKRYLYKNRTLSIVFSVLILVFLVAALVGIYVLKKDSADGRLFLWKVTGQAIAEHPWIGTGLGGFPAAYAEAQATYFVSGNASETERMVAGCPEYGFNEFLQIGLEQGLTGLMVFVWLLAYSLFRGVKNRQVGAVGGILALMVFGLASYPLQLPEFWVALVVLMGIATTSVNDNMLPVPRKKRLIFIVVVGFLVVCCGWIVRQQKGYYEGYKKWDTLQVLYNSNAYEVVNEGYQELVPVLGHKPELLFEAAQCLSKADQFAEANQLLKRAMKLSSDPMIHYMVAKNEQSQGNYQFAENVLLHAIDILPERIYPYYLLTKLYSEKEFFQEDKFLKAANAVLSKEPKVESVAIREMKAEVKKMLIILW